MLMCLDIGNTHILGGIFDKKKLIARFRYATHLVGTADQLGIFLLNFLNAKKIKVKMIKSVALCSVVPSHDYTINRMLAIYFNITPFILKPDLALGLNVKYKNPQEVGADRIANAIGAIDLIPKKNLIIIDMGTATTICAVSKNKDYLGGTILPGIRLGMEALKNNTAKLMSVDIHSPSSYLGKTTKESIQSGLFYGQLGALKEIISGFNQELFKREPAIIIGTGGFAQLFKDTNIFNHVLPDLVLQGLKVAHQIAGL